MKSGDPGAKVTIVAVAGSDKFPVMLLYIQAQLAQQTDHRE